MVLCCRGQSLWGSLPSSASILRARAIRVSCLSIGASASHGELARKPPGDAAVRGTVRRHNELGGVYTRCVLDRPEIRCVDRCVDRGSPVLALGGREKWFRPLKGNLPSTGCRYGRRRVESLGPGSRPRRRKDSAQDERPLVHENSLASAKVTADHIPRPAIGFAPGRTLVLSVFPLVGEQAVTVKAAVGCEQALALSTMRAIGSREAIRRLRSRRWDRVVFVRTSADPVEMRGLTDLALAVASGREKGHFELATGQFHRARRGRVIAVIARFFWPESWGRSRQWQDGVLAVSLLLRNTPAELRPGLRSPIFGPASAFPKVGGCSPTPAAS